jgi:hypothetical protein
MLRPVELDWATVRAHHERLRVLDMTTPEDFSMQFPARRHRPIDCHRESAPLPTKARAGVARRVRGRPPLRVLGIGAPRVAGASIVLAIVAGNTNAPSIMIGETGAAARRGARKLWLPKIWLPLRGHQQRGARGTEGAGSRMPV